ncbi:MAG TPA: hypothetical protein VF898_08815 [Chloroflexota bacterium]
MTEDTVPSHLLMHLEDALVYANKKHAHQRRKGTNVPYISHLLQLAGIVLENGGDGDPQQWVVSLARTQRLGVQRFVPGHGPVGTAVDLDATRRYIEIVVDRTRTAVERGETPEVAARDPAPPPFDTWRYPSFLISNIYCLMARYAGI